MNLTLLSADDLAAVLPMGATIEAMKKAFAALSEGSADQPRRLSVRSGDGGVLLVKPAAQAGVGLGTKLVSVFPANVDAGLPLIHGLVALFDPATGAPTALLDGGFLTAWRTGAASGAATDLLARADARIAAVIGSGVQAATQARAIDEVRQLAEIRFYSRNPNSVERCVSGLERHLRARPLVAPSAAAAVAQADVVCTATTSAAPVVADSCLAPGCHINAIGTFAPTARELEGRTVGRARVFVDSAAAASAEAGDLLLAESEGRTERRDWIELGEVATGRHPGRSNRSELTLFKSVGVAVQDLAAAVLALANARARGIGQQVDL